MQLVLFINWTDLVIAFISFRQLMMYNIQDRAKADLSHGWAAVSHDRHTGYQPLWAISEQVWVMAQPPWATQWTMSEPPWAIHEPLWAMNELLGDPPWEWLSRREPDWAINEPMWIISEPMWAMSETLWVTNEPLWAINEPLQVKHKHQNDKSWGYKTCRISDWHQSHDYE